MLASVLRLVGCECKRGYQKEVGCRILADILFVRVVGALNGVRKFIYVLPEFPIENWRIGEGENDYSDWLNYLIAKASPRGGLCIYTTF